MYCPKCGASCGDNERFCPSCGASLEQQAAPVTGAASPTAQAKPGLKLSPKVIGIAAVAVVAVIVIVVLVNVIGGLFSGGGGFGSYSANAIQFIGMDDEYVIYAGTKEIDKVDDLSTYSIQYNIGLSMAAFLDDDTLYVVDGKKLTEVDDGVTNFYLSANGSVLAYTNDENEVYYYNVSKGGKATKIGEGDAAVNLGIPSPDGSVITFASVDDDGEIEGFLSKNGKEAESMGDDIIPLSSSNGGSYVYYAKMKSAGEMSLYVLKGKDEVRLEKNYNVTGGIWFNSDGTQMLYCNDGSTYLSVKGGESDKILSSTLSSLVAPSRTASSVYRGNMCYTTYSDLRGRCYSTYGDGVDVYYVDGKGETAKVVSGCDSCSLSSNGKSMIYRKNGDLVKVEDVTKGKNSKTVELTDEGDITSFIAMPDLSAVYYAMKDELYYQKGTGKAVEVGDDVEYFFWAADNSVCYIINKDDELYTSKGKEMTVVKELDDVDLDFSGYYAGVCFFAQRDDDEYVLYIATGNKPKEFATGVTSVY